MAQLGVSNTLVEINMQERKAFKIIESPSRNDVDFIELKMGEKRPIPFTGSEIIFAATNSGKKAVVKIPFNNNDAQREWVGLKAAHLADIRVPTPIALINFQDDRLAIVSGFIEGENLYDNPNPNAKIKVGNLIKKMHQNTKVDGLDWKSSERNTFAYYDKHIFSWTSGELEEFQIDNRTISLLNKFTDTMADFCISAKPVFNHNDLHDGQIIIDSKGNPNIMDFGNWIEESWMNDISYHLFHLVRTERVKAENFTNFLKGYLGNERLTESEKSILAFYLLFISTRALSYFHKRKSSYLPTAKENHLKILSFLEDEEIWKKY